jgi:hypothetical protein
LPLFEKFNLIWKGRCRCDFIQFAAFLSVLENKQGKKHIANVARWLKFLPKSSNEAVEKVGYQLLPTIIGTSSYPNNKMCLFENIFSVSL